MDDRVEKSAEEWRRTLTPDQYRVLREKGTERAFSGALWDDHQPGSFLCAGCGSQLFRPEDKFESGTGWPSFTRPADARGRIRPRHEPRHGARRGTLPPLRRAPRTRLPGRPGAD